MSYLAWLMDLDGTLYRPWWVKLAMGVELVVTGTRSIRQLQTFRLEHEKMREEGYRSKHGCPFDEQVRRAAEKCSVDKEQLRLVVMRWMVSKPSKWIRRFAREDLLEEVRQYRAEGGVTALVSDYPARTKLSALGAEDLFDVVVANGEEGGPAALKPNPDGYLAAANKLGIDPAHCLVIGDRDDADGEAARRAGMSFRLIE